MFNVVLISGTKQVTDSFNSLELWEGQNFSLVAVADNVKEALSKNPDVIICPAKSSFADGAELSRKFSHQNDKVKVVLYGRRTYEHARLAVNARAWGYIGMPLEKNEFVQLLLNLEQFMDKEKRNDGADVRKEDLPILRENLFFELLSGQIDDVQSLKEKYDLVNLKGDPDKIGARLVKITIDNFNDFLQNKWKYGKDSLYTAVNNFIIKNDEHFFITPVSRNENEIYVMLYGNLNGGEDGNLAEIKRNIQEIMGINISYTKVQNFGRLTDVILWSKSDDANPFKAESETISDSEDEKIVISNAKEYINKCYDKEIGLDDVAKFVCLSSAYFSRLFKQETGENFIDYLVKVRMENAKRILVSSNCKTYEISQQVGYKKSKYFSKLFKNYTGYTPTEYRVRSNRRRQAERLKTFTSH